MNIIQEFIEFMSKPNPLSRSHKRFLPFVVGAVSGLFIAFSKDGLKWLGVDDGVFLRLTSIGLYIVLILIIYILIFLCYRKREKQ